MKQQAMRDRRIDLLRFIGLMMIILAHVGPPGLIFQARNFDVPMMVLISGASFALSHQQHEAYIRYFWKRIKRLLIPTWLFLTIYFISTHLFKASGDLPTQKQIIESYTLQGGIGYVWIIRVFLLMAMIAPLILKIEKGVTSRSYAIGLILAYSLYEISLTQHIEFTNDIANVFYKEVLQYIIPYGIVFSIGLKLRDMSPNIITALSTIALVIFISIFTTHYLATGKIVQTQDYKYPAQLYYISYALFVSFLTWQFSSKLLEWTNGKHTRKLIDFISSNSIWIYLWHIAFVENIGQAFYIKFILVFTAATTITYIQVHVVKTIIAPRIKNQTTRKNFITLLTG